MTTIPLTPALRQELKAALKDNTIQFPYECSDDALAFIADEADGWMEMRALHEQTIRRCGRSIVAIPKEDENGNIVTHPKTGKALAEFCYTLGQGRKGLPEILCFYPSQTIGFAINRLCDQMESGEWMGESCDYFVGNGARY
ncbi:MAG: hypothetical protein CL862_02630 [Cyanobium sp. NAT70]|nr:hypothetical protein [Cyanobium sp. NAT70]|tara:strand:+ start:139 stop:564 length:426 start_codon:yes stop_codon:yes gene_type:complete